MRTLGFFSEQLNALRQSFHKSSDNTYPDGHTQYN